MPIFNHLHCHSQYSLLDGQASIKNMFKKAEADGMRGLALTDHGNMFGALEFIKTAKNFNVKPIVGCEFYLVENRHKKEFTKEHKDQRFHQLFLAKDQEGYENLSKLCSLGYLEGMYSKYPRIDKELVQKYHKGLIATTCCIGAEVPQAILNRPEGEAEELFKWWLDLFGSDYYVELQRHGMREQEQVNQVLLQFAKKYNVPIIASNDSHYVNREDALPHDILLCLNTGARITDPVWKEEGTAPKGYRFGFPNEEFYFKTTAEMEQIFADLPQAIDNTNEIVDKVTPPTVFRKPLLPNFQLPDGFNDADEYLRFLTYEGAKRRYATITEEVSKRLDYELEVIKNMGFAGYFLIVQDFINAGKEMGVFVGPGRGSAAGSAVAYCIGITNLDPIKYSLLFERFLNPERVSMPDIDIDFDDVERQKVLDYVVNKYGHNQVAQIITFSKMGAKSAIKDVARTMDFEVKVGDELSKMIPEAPGMTLKMAYEQNPELEALRNSNDARAKIFLMAEKLEGSVRNTGIHAAGVIIAPDELTKFIPVCTSKESPLLVTQVDGKLIEEAGMLKMDFLGLRNLSNMKACLVMLKEQRGIEINLDEIPLDDEKTLELYQRGDTVGTFQFESDGMRKYLKELKPTHIEDLIAMNALYRPGPMAYIPQFINRKHGKEPIEYPHPLLEEILKPTYGIMVYQEQIMQAAQILAGFSLGAADMLRRAMGKKDAKIMAEARDSFVEGALKHQGIPKEQGAEIFNKIEQFAKYGFNRSHAAAYTVLAFQTAYLKAHYPAEYMAAILSSFMGNIDQITNYIEECRHMDLKVLGPDVNESRHDFSVNKKGEIRFGLQGIKGAGEAAVKAIVEEQLANGPFKSIWDFAVRVSSKSVNKKTYEALARCGAFDCFDELHRAQYFATDEKGVSNIERIIKYSNQVLEGKNNVQQSLFGDESSGSNYVKPSLVNCEPWSDYEKLKEEKEVVGFYLSGHPLDSYIFQIRKLCNATIKDVGEIRNTTLKIAAILSKRVDKRSKTGNPFCILTLEDQYGSMDVFLFGKDIVRLDGLLKEGNMLLITGRNEPKYKSEEEYEFKMSDAQLLENLDVSFSSLIAEIDLDTFGLKEMDELEELLKGHSGGTSVSFHIKARLETEAGIEIVKLPMKINNYKVKLSENFLVKIKRIPGISYVELKDK